MQISSYSGKARVFVDNRWSEWLPYDEAKALEMSILYPPTRSKKGIYLKADAEYLRITPAGAGERSRGTQAELSK